MKIFARFYLENKRYYCKEANAFEMEIVGMLMDSDIGCRKDTFFTDWLDDPEMWGVGANATTVDRMKDETIEIRDVLDEEWGPAFVMPKEQYLKMVLDWQDLCKHKPKEIIITWDGKEITVEGRN